MEESQNYWNPFRDWNPLDINIDAINPCLKTTETLLGIETSYLYALSSQNCSLKTTETLLGIETKFLPRTGLTDVVSKLLKPF